MSSPVLHVKPFLAPAPDVSAPPAQPPSLGVTLRADFDALQNDFEQANELAADLQRQLSGKSNEFADLKHLFDKTARDFLRIQDDIAALRAERHRLANEAMKATALEFQLNEMTADRDRLKKELFTLRASPSQVPNHCGNPEHKKQITALTLELEEIKRNPPPAPGGLDPDTLKLIRSMAVTVDHIADVVDRAKSRSPKTHAFEKVESADSIQIEFST